MKSKLLLLALLIGILSFGQQVPNTITFKLDTVADVVNPTTRDLVDCFADANTDYWNYYYKDQYYSDFGSLNNLQMFRNYGSHNANLTCALSGAGASSSTTATTLSVQSPPNLANGDLVLIVFLADNGGTITTPTGYTDVHHVISGGHFTVGIYYIIYNGSNLGSVTISNSGGAAFNKTLQAFRFSGQETINKVSGGGALDVTTLTNSTNVTSGNYSLIIFSAHDNAMASTYPAVSKDYYSVSYGTFYNSVFSIKVACAPLSYQKYEWYWAGGTADYLDYCVTYPDAR